MCIVEPKQYQEINSNGPLNCMFRHDNYFKGENSPSFDANQSIQFIIQFSNVINTILPSNYAGKGRGIKQQREQQHLK